MAQYVVRHRRTGKYVEIVDRFPQMRDAEAQGTRLSYDDMCDYIGFHTEAPRDYKAVRIDGPIAAVRTALRRLIAGAGKALCAA